MREFQLPYGKSKQILMVDDRHLAGALQSGLHDYQPEKDGSALVQEALENPIGSPRLCDLAVGKKKVVVIDAAHEPVYAVAGDCDLAHRAGTDFLASKCRVDAVPADIAVTTNGGYPLDQNIYQAVKGMTAAEATVKKDGVIVMLSRANDGDGGRSFHETFKNERNLQVMMNGFLETMPENTIIDQWQSQILCRVLMKAKVIFVSDCDDRTVEEMHMIPARNVEEAMEIAVALTGKDDYTVTVIPDGVGVIVRNL